MALKMPIYLDYNATTPVDARVLEAMLPYFTQKFGNAASNHHSFGWAAAEAADYAREKVARLIGAAPQEIIFTSGATESINLALKGVLEAYAVKGNHIITCATEHKAVLDTCKHLEKNGTQITVLPVSQDGLIELSELEAAITDRTVLIAVMYGNNETGVIQPISAISAIARKHGVIFFTDATQAIGKLKVNVQEDGIDLMAMSAHKIYGPKGVGALFVRRRDPRVRLVAQQDGGGHERGMRSGTLNVPGIVGLGMACELLQQELEAETERIKQLRDRLESQLMKIDGVQINGNRQHRLPNVCNLSFGGVTGNNLLIALNKSLAVSSGSACTSASPEPSHVLQAMGLDLQTSKNTIRFSLGRYTTEEEIDYTGNFVTATLKKLRENNFLASKE